MRLSMLIAGLALALVPVAALAGATREEESKALAAATPQAKMAVGPPAALARDPGVSVVGLLYANRLLTSSERVVSAGALRLSHLGHGSIVYRGRIDSDGFLRRAAFRMYFTHGTFSGTVDSDPIESRFEPFGSASGGITISRGTGALRGFTGGGSFNGRSRQEGSARAVLDLNIRRSR